VQDGSWSLYTVRERIRKFAEFIHNARNRECRTGPGPYIQYESVSGSSRNSSITKFMLSFDIGLCSVQSSPPSSLCSGYRVYASARSTNRTDFFFLEFPVRRSAIAPEFNERLETVSFLETRRNRKWTPGE